MKVFDEFFVLVRGSLKVVQMDHFTGTPSKAAAGLRQP